MKDLDLEGIVFGDMPWLLTKGSRIESLREIALTEIVSR
jgi:hypothetical protein